MPFTCEVHKQGKVVSEVKFLLPAFGETEVMPTKSPSAEAPVWAKTLAEIGVGFEAHLEQVYLNDRFVLEKRDDMDWLVKR